MLIAGGTAVVVAGIVLCSRAGARKEAAAGTRHKRVGRGVAIAVGAGVLSSLPNVGMTFGHSVIVTARAYGASAHMAANAVWALFFTMGFTVNAAYCLYLIRRRGTSQLLVGSGAITDLALSALMGLLWIASFYAYGLGAARMSTLGPVIGWPLFIACAIGVGNLVGFWRGEWKDAPPAARALLGRGLITLFSAVALIAASGAIP
jgi:L-rhamnose-H+ transport protein